MMSLCANRVGTGDMSLAPRLRRGRAYDQQSIPDRYREARLSPEQISASMICMDQPSPTAPLYESLADHVTALVDSGVLRVGMRAPSVRAFAGQHRISLTTALQTYRLLEDRGVLQARPKSGFYVTSRPHRQRALPEASRPPQRAMAVAVTNPVFSILAYTSDPSYAPLGCALPSAGLLA